MQVVRRAVSVAVAAAVAVAASDSVAGASQGDWGINGTFRATSNGQWAKTNDVYRDEASVRSIWTITTVCSSPVACEGEVRTDQGWTAPIYTTNGFWYVKRVIARWEPCADGSAVDGLQIFTLYPVDDEGQVAPSGSRTWAGQDMTTGRSGACGINAPLVIRMPFRLDQIS